MLENTAAICGPVYLEILRGVQSPKDRHTLLELLEGCHQLDQPEGLWEDAGHCGFQMQRKGVTAKSMDLIIACYAMAHDVPLFSLDGNFIQMRDAGLALRMVGAELA